MGILPQAVKLNKLGFVCGRLASTLRVEIMLFKTTNKTINKTLLRTGNMTKSITPVRYFDRQKGFESGAVSSHAWGKRKIHAYIHEGHEQFNV